MFKRFFAFLFIMISVVVISQNCSADPVQKGDQATVQEESSKGITASLQNLIKTTDSNGIRLLLAFFLGLLMSLTPCIYPMIPITVGILQAQGKKSIGHNFLLSLTYTCGIATTFAMCGVVAALTGAICGQIMTSPIFVIVMIALLLYFAFSMLGFYDMYTPKFGQNAAVAKGGSFFSVFTFGALSGTMASPCLTPGLALLLTIVGSIGSYVIGFILLFAFGIGLSIPLLIIGTFSSSLNMLPRAGMWMVEVKKLFGFMLIGMALYMLNNIVPWHMMLWIIGVVGIQVSGWYLWDAQKNRGFIKILKSCAAIAAIIGSGFVLKTAYFGENKTTKVVCAYGDWEIDYDHARECAQAANKKIFIDFWATFCSICKAIDKTVLADEDTLNQLKSFVMLKVDGTDPDSEPFATLHKTYAIKGFPTFLLVDAQTGDVVHQWGSEIYNDKASFIKDLKRLS